MSNKEMRNSDKVKNLPKIENPEQYFNKVEQETTKKDAKRNKYWRSLNILNNPDSNHKIGLENNKKAGNIF